LARRIEAQQNAQHDRSMRHRRSRRQHHRIGTQQHRGEDGYHQAVADEADENDDI
jgi:hypothetical protein